MLLHGEHYMEFKEELLPGEKLLSNVSVISVEDKGRGATVTFRVTTVNDKGVVKLINEGTTFNRGAKSKTAANENHLNKKLSQDIIEVYKSKPTYTAKQPTTTNQAIIYRLSGDRNPLHMYELCRLTKLL
jgi:acyl dehydratase